MDKAFIDSMKRQEQIKTDLYLVQEIEKEISDKKFFVKVEDNSLILVLNERCYYILDNDGNKVNIFPSENAQYLKQIAKEDE